MIQYNLFDIAKPKQWKTISSSELIEDGEYSVYGANGIIGKTNHYNHEEETVLITCRGATCGEINLSEPFSYINGNAMALDNLDQSKVILKYLFYFLKNYDFKNIITGSAQPQITRESLKRVEILAPDLETQNKIVAILDKANGLVKKREATIEKYDELLRAKFLDIFGDPVQNSKGWKSELLLNLSKPGTGGTPSRAKEELYYNGDIYWVKTTEVKGGFILDTEEKITTQAIKESNCKVYPQNTILIAMYGQGKTRGNVGLLKIDAATNQACAAIIPSDKINQLFLFYLLKYSYDFIRSLGRGGNQENLNLEIIGSLRIILPAIELQNKFEEICLTVANSKEKLSRSLVQTMILLESLSQLAFKGELTFNTAVDLEVLLENDYEFFKANSTAQSIQLLLDRLDKNELKDNKIYEEEAYNKAKSFVYGLLQEGKVKQAFDAETNTVKLALA